MVSDTRHFYDAVWTDIAKLDDQSPASFHRRRLIRKLTLRFARDPATVLDAGCGPGQLLAELAVHLPHAALAGGDVSPASLDLARQRCSTADLFELDLEGADFETRQAARLGSFNLVVCSEVLEHIADDARAVARLRELVTEGGVLVVTVPSGKMSRFDEAIGHQRHYRLAELRALLAANGFEPLFAMAWGFPFQNLYRSAVRVASRFAFAPGSKSGAPKKPLGLAYLAFGQLLRPLFFLNLPVWGEQLFAVARRRES